MDFYMTLSSNVNSFKIFGVTNKISNFKTKLGRLITLEGEWVVGVASISYTKSWYNVLHPHNISLIDELGKVYSDKKTKIPAGFYDTPMKLITEINKILTKFTTIKAPKIVYNEIDNCVKVEAGKMDKTNKVFPYLGDEIENILGLRNRSLNSMVYSHEQSDDGMVEYIINSKTNYNHSEVQAYHPVEITGGYHALYLYSDVVYPTLVGDSFAQLLRVVEVPRKHKFGDTVHLNYDKIYYMPVMINNFETIEISIKDDTDNLIPFMFGRCTIVLHFKKL